MNFETLTIDVGPVALHCELCGDGPTVLFVHGYPLSREMWQATAQRLAPHFRSVVPDLRGHGKSPATERVSIADFSDDMARVLTAIAPEERGPAGRGVVIVGLSLGGIIAFEFFRRHRAWVRALGLVCTRANAETPEGIARREALAEAALREGSRAVTDAMIGSVFAPQAPAALRQEWYERMCATSPEGMAATSRALAGRADSWPTLSQIDVPTLVVAGEQDAITPVATLREIHAGIRASRLEVIADSGHVPPVEQPEAFARVLESFLAALPS